MTFLFLTFSNLSLFTKAAKSLREEMENWPKIGKTKIEMFQKYLRRGKEGVSTHGLDNAALMPWLEYFTRLSPSLVSSKLTRFWPINFVRYDFFRNSFVVGNDIDQSFDTPSTEKAELRMEPKALWRKGWTLILSCQLQCLHWQGTSKPLLLPKGGT